MRAIFIMYLTIVICNFAIGQELTEDDGFLDLLDMEIMEGVCTDSSFLAGAGLNASSCFSSIETTIANCKKSLRAAQDGASDIDTVRSALSKCVRSELTSQQGAAQ